MEYCVAHLRADNCLLLISLVYSILAGHTIKAAYLIDPVAMDELQPAAVAELNASHMTVGATAAGVTGAFNPQRTNFRVCCGCIAITWSPYGGWGIAAAVAGMSRLDTN